MIRKVIVVGGGVAGLTAAHELAERGFQVTLYERNLAGQAGGKARSVDTAAEGAWYQSQRGEADARPRRGHRRGLPGEHGFRFFPGWYRHLPDTMKRIPYRGDGKTVFDNLVPADMALFASYDREPVRAMVKFPSNWQELRRLAAFPEEILRLGLTAEDLSFFLGKMFTFLTSSEERRLAEFETQSWWDFMEADRQSKAFRDYLVVGATRNLVAARPQEASAYTIAKMVLQTTFDAARPDRTIDRILNGPTNEVWIDPWVAHLRAQGVVFRHEYELDAVELDASGNVSGMRFFRPPYEVRSAREALESAEQALSLCQETAAWLEPLFDWPGSTLPEPAAQSAIVREAGYTLRPAPSDLQRARLRAAGFGAGTVHDRFVSELLRIRQGLRDGSPPSELVRDIAGRLWPVLDEARTSAEQSVAARRAALDAALDRRAVAEAGESTPESSVHVLDHADFYVLALPVEQMAYYVHRSESLKRRDPSLVNIVRLAEHVDWMAGIQLYLNEKVRITRGHIDFLDSEWHLTGVAQSQFWSEDHEVEDYGNGTVRMILSIDISAWDKPGRLHGKPAWDCTPDEIAEEVWAQVKASLNRPGAAEILHDDMLCKETEERWYYLDSSIADRYDRRKQGFYEKFRSVGFHAQELLRRSRQSEAPPETPEAHGNRLLQNAEPLLINRPGSWRLRPEASTAIRNLFLAGDYVRTETNLATMEAANESARRAVNEILRQCRENHQPVRTFGLWEPLGTLRNIDEQLYARKLRFETTNADIPVRVLAGAARHAAGLAGRAMSAFWQAAGNGRRSYRE